MKYTNVGMYFFVKIMTFMTLINLHLYINLSLKYIQLFLYVA